MPAAGENNLKIVSSNMQKQRKVACRRQKIVKYGTFQIQECISFMKVQPLLKK